MKTTKIPALTSELTENDLTALMNEKHASMDKAVHLLCLDDVPPVTLREHDIVTRYEVLGEMVECLREAITLWNNPDDKMANATMKIKDGGEGGLELKVFIGSTGPDVPPKLKHVNSSRRRIALNGLINLGILYTLGKPKVKSASSDYQLFPEQTNLVPTCLIYQVMSLDEEAVLDFISSRE